MTLRMTLAFGFAAGLLSWSVGCSGAPPAPAKAPAPAACPSVIGGSVHDLDDHERPLAGATVVLGRAGLHERTALTDTAGTFVVEYAAQPVAGISVYLGDATAEGALPACVDKLVWIGVHTRATSGDLVIRMEDRSVDLAAVQRAAERREALADHWLAFYEGFGKVVDDSHADCGQLATALARFVEQQRSAVDAIKAQQAAMSNREREAFKDTVEQKLSSRSAAVQAKLKRIEACQSEPRVRRALRDLPR